MFRFLASWRALGGQLDNYTVEFANLIHGLHFLNVMADSYQLNLGGLLGLCGVLFVAQRHSARETPDDKSKTSKNLIKDKVTDAAEASQWPFLTVFALVMGSDWLQARLIPGPTTTAFTV